MEGYLHFPSHKNSRDSIIIGVFVAQQPPGAARWRGDGRRRKCPPFFPPVQSGGGGGWGGSVIMLQETNWFGQRGTAALYWRGGCREVISLHADPKQPHFPSRTCSQIQTGGVFSPRLLEFDGKTFPLCLPKQWNNALELNDFHENRRVVAASFHTWRQNPKMQAYGTMSLRPISSGS